MAYKRNLSDRFYALLEHGIADGIFHGHTARAIAKMAEVDLRAQSWSRPSSTNDARSALSGTGETGEAAL